MDGLGHFESVVGQTLPNALFFAKVYKKSLHLMGLEEINLKYDITSLYKYTK